MGDTGQRPTRRGHAATPAGRMTRTVDVLEEVVREIDAGRLSATSAERAYLVGASAALRSAPTSS